MFVATIQWRSKLAALGLLVMGAGNALAQDASPAPIFEEPSQGAPPRPQRGMPPGPPPGMPPPVPAGTLAPDGIGVTVGPAPTAGSMDEGGFGPWVDADTVSPLQVGDKIPGNSALESIDGDAFDLNAAVAKQPTLLIFYRGGWCPYCNAHLRELQGSAAELQAMGYQILAVSTDTPAQLREFLADQSVGYTLLSDSKVEVAARFGLRFQVVDHYLDHVKNDRGQDLKALNGGYLLTPGAFVLDQTGTIRFAYVNNNFAVRASQSALLEAAQAALD